MNGGDILPTPYGKINLVDKSKILGCSATAGNKFDTPVYGILQKGGNNGLLLEKT